MFVLKVEHFLYENIFNLYNIIDNKQNIAIVMHNKKFSNYYL